MTNYCLIEVWKRTCMLLACHSWHNSCYSAEPIPHININLINIEISMFTTINNHDINEFTNAIFDCHTCKRFSNDLFLHRTPWFFRRVTRPYTFAITSLFNNIWLIRCRNVVGNVSLKKMHEAKTRLKLVLGQEGQKYFKKILNLRLSILIEIVSHHNSFDLFYELFVQSHSLSDFNQFFFFLFCLEFLECTSWIVV